MTPLESPITLLECRYKLWHHSRSVIVTLLIVIDASSHMEGYQLSVTATRWQHGSQMCFANLFCEKSQNCLKKLNNH